ncbi:MAG TPA: hypothetical protein PKA41_00150 [Verrucomicrobiota bacterium]|nr:hypothetical protein [Verrucomicrobiota bacterium]
MPTPTDLECFVRWFAVPVETLKTLPNGDAAFVALSVGFLLCERYYRITTTSQEEVPVDKSRNRAAEEMNVNKKFFSIFWSTYRNGLMHQGTPKIYECDGIKYKWMIDAEFEAYPTYYDRDGFRFICLNPWKFTDFMISKFLNNPQHLNGSLIYELGHIFDAKLVGKPIQVPLNAAYPD